MNEITIEQYRAAVDVACEAVLSGAAGRQRYEKAVAAALTSLGVVVVYGGDVPLICVCPLDERVYCAADGCRGGAALEPEWVWASATWSDVREGDVVRMPGAEATAARVSELGVVGHWHVDPDSPPRFPVAREWSNRMVTLTPLAAGDAMRPERGMNPAAAVEIRTTAEEFAAIELLGGWGLRA